MISATSDPPRKSHLHSEFSRVEPKLLNFVIGNSRESNRRDRCIPRCSLFRRMAQVYRTCPVPMQCPCSAHAVPMQCPCSAHAVPMQCPCSAHAVPMQCPCSAHAVPMQCPCSAHAVPMQCPCSAASAASFYRANNSYAQSVTIGIVRNFGPINRFVIQFEFSLLTISILLSQIRMRRFLACLSHSKDEISQTALYDNITKEASQ